MEPPLKAFAFIAWRHADSITKAFECRTSGRRVQVKCLTPLGIASLVVRFVLIVILLPQTANAKRVKDFAVVGVRGGLVIIRNVLKEAREHVLLRKEILLFSWQL